MKINKTDILDKSSESHSWYALYTMVRHEKVVNNALQKKDIKTFLPLRTSINRWSDRKKEVSVPLFPGYIFIHAGWEEISKSLNTRSVVRVLGNSDGPIPIPDMQIEGIRTLIENKINFEAHPLIKVGREVVVSNGPLEGFTGKVIEKRGSYKLILSLDLIKRSVSAEVDINDVELV